MDGRLIFSEFSRQFWQFVKEKNFFNLFVIKKFTFDLHIWWKLQNLNYPYLCQFRKYIEIFFLLSFFSNIMSWKVGRLIHFGQLRKNSFKSLCIWILIIFFDFCIKYVSMNIKIKKKTFSLLMDYLDWFVPLHKLSRLD